MSTENLLSLKYHKRFCIGICKMPEIQVLILRYLIIIVISDKDSVYTYH